MRHPNKVRLLIPLGLFLLISVCISGCRLFNDSPVNPPTVTSDSGKTYTYSSGNDISEDSYRVFDINWATLSRKQIREVLDLNLETISEKETDPITTAEQAVCQGISVLNEVFETWTEDNRVGVFYSKTANVWLVHGMYVDRNTEYDGLGLVVFDASTGEILGTAYETGGTWG